MAPEITPVQLQKSLAELAGYVKGLAKEIYKDDFPEEGEGNGNGYDDMAGDGVDENGQMPYDDESEEMYMARMLKGFKAKKGFADAAEEASSEEDSKWDEKDAKIEGNEPSPAGDQAGTEEDETFGPGGMSYSAMLKSIGDISKVVEGIAQKVNGEQVVLSKGIVPGSGPDNRYGAQNQGGVVTREMQVEAKSRSWKDLNRLRMDVGDLPRNVF